MHFNMPECTQILFRLEMNVVTQEIVGGVFVLVIPDTVDINVKILVCIKYLSFHSGMPKASHFFFASLSIFLVIESMVGSIILAFKVSIYSYAK